MGHTRTDYNESIIQRQIRTGRASNKSEVIQQALPLLDAVSRGNGPEGATFRNAEELESLLLQAGPAEPMTAARKAKNLRQIETMKWQAWKQESARFF